MISVRRLDHERPSRLPAGVLSPRGPSGAPETRPAEADGAEVDARPAVTRPADPSLGIPASGAQAGSAAGFWPRAIAAVALGVASVVGPAPSIAGYALRGPDPVREDLGIVYLGQLPGTLFVDGASAEDVVQGQISACFFSAALAAWANADPSGPPGAIVSLGPHLHAVRLFRGGAPEWVVVDDQLFLRSGGKPYYTRGALPYELWPAIFEKAYAAWSGGYDAIGNGGSLVPTLEALTGRPARLLDHAIWTPDAVYEKISDALLARQPVLAGTHGKDRAAKYVGRNIYAWHVYSVLGVQTGEGGERFVVLRNPWGEGEPADNPAATDVDRDGDGKLDGDDGIFRLPLTEFHALMRETAFSQ